MSLFRFMWLRQFIRRRTNPIPQQKAAKWKRKLALGYAILSWHAFGFVCYMIYSGKSDWAKSLGLKSKEEVSLSPAQQWTQTLGIKDAQVYKISGLKVVEKYDIHNELNQEEEEKKRAETHKVAQKLREEAKNTTK